MCNKIAEQIINDAKSANTIAMRVCGPKVAVHMAENKRRGACSKNRQMWLRRAFTMLPISIQDHFRNTSYTSDILQL